MIRVSLPKLDLNEVPADQQSQAILRQLASVIEQINVSLSAIGPEDIVVAEGVTLSEYLGIGKE